MKKARMGAIEIELSAVGSEEREERKAKAVNDMNNEKEQKRAVCAPKQRVRLICDQLKLVWKEPEWEEERVQFMSSHRHCLQALKRCRRSVWSDKDDYGTGANETPSASIFKSTVNMAHESTTTKTASCFWRGQTVNQEEKGSSSKLKWVSPLRADEFCLIQLTTNSAVPLYWCSWVLHCTVQSAVYSTSASFSSLVALFHSHFLPSPGPKWKSQD